MILLLSLRYAFSRSNREKNIRMIISLTLSVIVIVITTSIVSFLQNERFSLIRDIKSFDILISGDKEEEIHSLYPKLNVFSYGEGVALLDGDGYNIRYISSSYDGGLNVLGLGEGIILPLKKGSKYLYKDSVELTILKEGKSGAVVPKVITYSSPSLYYTALESDFDSHTIFLPKEEADDTVHFYTAIKGATKKEEKELSSLYDVTTWKEKESSLYSVMKMEKSLVYIILLLLFLIVGVSLRGNVKIFLERKKNERKELLILGLSKIKVSTTFVLSFLIISLISLFLGGILGFLSLLGISEISRNVRFIINMDLKFPTITFILFSLIFIIITVLIVLYQNRKIYKEDLYNGR